MSASKTIVSGKSDERTTNRYLSLAFPLALYLVGACVFFRAQIFSNFDLVFGDVGDARLVVFLHEHLYGWLRGDGSEFLSPPFFFNQTGTLGYSDAFLLDQIIYAPLRLLGAEPLLATSLVAIILSPIAYLFVYLFLRRLDVSLLMASFAALTFTFANNLYLKSGHLQHFAVYYIPIIVYCGLLAASEVQRRPVRAHLLGAFAAGLYGLLFSTGYYMAWFFGFALLIFAPIASYLAWPQLRAWWRVRPRRVLSLGLVAGVSFVAALSIFAIIYAPVLTTGAKRDFDEYLVYAPLPIDIVNVGTGNFVWGRAIRSLDLFLDERAEVSTALTPVVQILLLLSAILAFRSRFWPASDPGRTSRAFVIASASVCIVFFLVTIKIDGDSLFHVLYALVPGANAIRAGYRAMVVANLFAVTAIALTFDRVLRLSLREPRAFVRVGRLTAVTALLTVALIEQVNLDKAAKLSRKGEREYFSALGKAPRSCRAFYVASEAGRTAAAQQVDAMMIALAQHLPTINGQSGLIPPGWDVYTGNAQNYEARAARWALKRHIADGLCRADLDTGVWTAVARDRDWICTSGSCVRHISFNQSGEFEIDFKSDANGVLFTDDHWEDPDPTGRWTTATSAAISFSIGVPRDLVIALSAAAMISPNAPKQSLWVETNRCRVGGIEFDFAQGDEPKTLTGAIPAECMNADGTIVLQFHTDRAATPHEVGIDEADNRHLGVLVEYVLIREANFAGH